MGAAPSRRRSGKRRAEDFLPLALRAALPALEAELRALAVLRADHAGADGSRRLLVGLADGRAVEARAAAARRPVRVEPGRLRRRLRVLHDRHAAASSASSAAPRSSPRSRSRAACDR